MQDHRELDLVLQLLCISYLATYDCCVFQHNLSKLFFSDLCQLVLAATVPPGSDQPCHWMPPSHSDKKLFDKCWNHFPSMPLRPRIGGELGIKDCDAELVAMCNSHQDGERKTLIETRLWFISIVCLWESSCWSDRWRDIAEWRENEDNCGKNRKNNEGHAVKTNYIKIDIT